MSSRVSDKLRAEIHESKSNRHDFVLRKFAFSSTLLAAGSLKQLVPGGTVGIDFSPLLLLVPVVAIAFDFYIVTEDYRIKRAGEFIRRGLADAENHERSWEEFCKATPNRASTLAFFVVTMVFFLGSLMLLRQTTEWSPVLLWWVFLVLAAESALVFSSLRLRVWLERAGAAHQPGRDTHGTDPTESTAE